MFKSPDVQQRHPFPYPSVALCYQNQTLPRFQQPGGRPEVTLFCFSAALFPFWLTHQSWEKCSLLICQQGRHVFKRAIWCFHSHMHGPPTQGRGGKSPPFSMSIQDPILCSVPSLASTKNLAHQPHQPRDRPFTSR